MAGYIKLHRKITEWEWYKDINTTRLFVHLLLTINFKDTKYKGRIVERGSISTTISKLAEETALTIKEVRTACEHLVNTGDISKKTTNRETVIKVHNYDVYQDRESDEGQTKGKQRANERQPNGERTEEECKEGEEGKKDNILTDIKEEEPPPKNPPIPYEKIRAEYNRICVDFPKCSKLSDKRKEAIGARIHSGYVFDDFIRLFEIAQASDFLRGKNNKNWRADFDWLICDSNMAKSLDGRYENRSDANGANRNTSPQLPTGNTGEVKPKYGNVV